MVQGFAGGTLIPTVFAAVFILFQPRTQGIATTIAGIMAVLAPTVGPVVGGWITQVYSWHWLFLINVISARAERNFRFAALERCLGGKVTRTCSTLSPRRTSAFGNCEASALARGDITQ